MGAPFEIVAAPLTVYLAALGTAWPDVDEVPDGSWTKLGSSGDKNYAEGVTVTHDQTIEPFVPGGGTAPRKAFRTEEGLLIEFELVDLTPEQYAKILNDAAVTTNAPGAGTPGTKEFELLQGFDVVTHALLARGKSSVDDEFDAQYQVPIAYQAASPAPVHGKGAPARLACQFAALEDDTDGFGKLVIQTDAAS